MGTFSDRPLRRFGAFVGGYVPSIWGAGSFSMASLLFGGIGGIAGVWLGVRISDV